MSSQQPALSLSNRARASNPGRLDVQPLPYVISFPRLPLIFGAVLLAAGAAAMLVHWAFWLLVSLVLAAGAFEWVRLEEHFRYGCALPCRVVSTKPFRVAVYTDLRRGFHPYPAIKILEQPLHRRFGAPPSEGERMAAVAVYQPGEPQDHWTDFLPIVVDCVTRRSPEIKRVLFSIPESEWHKLEAGLGQLPDGAGPGLYMIENLPPAVTEKETTKTSPDGMLDPAPTPPEIRGLRLVLPSAPLVPWAAGLLLLAEVLVIDRSFVGGLLLAALGLGLALYADGDTQERLGSGGWPRHSAVMRAGYWLLGLAGVLDVIGGADALAPSLGPAMKSATFGLSIPGILLAYFGQSVWFGRLDHPRRRVVEREARRYRLLVASLIVVVLVAATAIAIRKRGAAGSETPPPLNGPTVGESTGGITTPQESPAITR